MKGERTRLTDHQQETLWAIARAEAKLGRIPNFQDVADELGKHVSTTCRRIHQLKALGVVSWQGAKSLTINEGWR